MKPERLELLMKAFDASVRRHAIFREIFGVI
jgi:ribosomal protein L33